MEATGTKMDPSFEGDMSKDILIIVIGNAGSGKSYFINRLMLAIGSREQVSEGARDVLHECTRNVKPIVVEERDWTKRYLYSSTKTNPTRFVVVDTPGLDAGSGISTVQEVADWVKKKYHSPKLTKFQMLIGGIICLHDISQDRFLDHTSGKLRLLHNKLPEQIPWSAVVLLTTKWGLDTDEKLAVKEKALKGNQWSVLVKQGVQVMRFEAGALEKKSALDAVHPAMERHNQWWARILTGQLQFRLRFLRTGRIKTQDFTQGYSAAVEGAIQLHERIAEAQIRLEEGKLAETEEEQLLKEWGGSLGKLKEFDDQVSFWNILSFAIRVVPPLLVKYSVTRRAD